MIKRVLITVFGGAAITTSVFCSDNINIEESSSPLNAPVSIFTNNAEDDLPPSPKRHKPEAAPQPAGPNILDFPTDLLTAFMHTTRIAEGIKFSLTCKKTNAVMNSTPEIFIDYIARIPGRSCHLTRNLEANQKELRTAYIHRVIPVLKKILVSFAKFDFKIIDGFNNPYQPIAISGNGQTILGTRIIEIHSPDFNFDVRDYAVPCTVTRPKPNEKEWKATTFQSPEASDDYLINYTASSIDYSGSQFVGFSANPEDYRFPMLWRKGKKKGHHLKYTVVDEDLGVSEASAVVTNDTGTIFIVGCNRNPMVQDCPYRATRWTVKDNQEKLQFLGTINEGDYSQASAISLDTKTIVGKSHDGEDSEEKAFIWTEAEGMRSLGTLPGHKGSKATGVSANGRLVVGNSGSKAFIWQKLTDQELEKLKNNPEYLIRAGGIMEYLNAPPNFSAKAIASSAEGSRIIGQMWAANNRKHAYVWESGNKLYSLEVILKHLLPAGVTIRSADSLSADGMHIVGRCEIPSTPQEGVRLEAFYAHVPYFNALVAQGINLRREHPSLPAQEAHG